jgi:hypothetical protein
MPQRQRQVSVNFLGKKRRSVGVATGNNAAWRCRCGRSLWLIGHTLSCSPGGPNTPAGRVECPHCRRHYFVVPRATAGNGAKRAIRVEEIPPLN